jgi:hypothetical protein
MTANILIVLVFVSVLGRNVRTGFFQSICGIAETAACSPTKCADLEGPRVCTLYGDLMPACQEMARLECPEWRQPIFDIEQRD